MKSVWWGFLGLVIVATGFAAAPLLAMVAALPYHFVDWAGGLLGAGGWSDTRMAFRVGVILGSGLSVCMLLGLGARELDARYLLSAVCVVLACMFFGALAIPLKPIPTPAGPSKPTLVHGEGREPRYPGGAGVLEMPPAPARAPRPSALPGTNLGASVDPASRNMRPPRYPPEAARAGIGGVVMLLIDLDASGNVTHISIERSSHDRNLDRAAIEAVRHWRFNPAIEDGVPVAARVRVPVKFRLD
ncbi:energy transducer TonB [Luteimonas sp. A537]